MVLYIDRVKVWVVVVVCVMVVVVVCVMVVVVVGVYDDILDPKKTWIHCNGMC